MPILPLILVFAAGAGALAFAASVKGSGGSDTVTVKHGVEYGPRCSYVKGVDPEAWTKYALPKMVSLAKTLKPDMRAIDGLAKMCKVAFPGSGCSWATDGEFDTTFITPHGEEITWAYIRGQLGSKTMLEATQDGTMDKIGLSFQASSGKTQSPSTNAVLRLIGA